MNPDGLIAAVIFGTTYLLFGIAYLYTGLIAFGVVFLIAAATCFATAFNILIRK